jgi:hypothetical protein
MLEKLGVVDLIVLVPVKCDSRPFETSDSLRAAVPRIGVIGRTHHWTNLEIGTLPVLHQARTASSVVIDASLGCVEASVPL